MDNEKSPEMEEKRTYLTCFPKLIHRYALYIHAGMIYVVALTRIIGPILRSISNTSNRTWLSRP
jgi:hypothetical protein